MKRGPMSILLFLPVVVVVAAVLAVPAVILGLKVKSGYRVSGMLLLLLVGVFIAFSVQPRFVPALGDNVAFSIPMDYRDRYMYGFPCGFWCSFVGAQTASARESRWQRWGGRFDPRGAFADAVLWGYLGLLACVPAGMELRRRRRERRGAGKERCGR